jgi:coatomer protein complex subunit alpha (xenin)
LKLHIRRSRQEARVLPVAVHSLQSIRSDLAEGYRLVSGNKLTDAQNMFRSVLESLLLVVLSSDDEAKLVCGSCFNRYRPKVNMVIFSGEKP